MKVAENKANDVETKQVAPNQTIEQMSSEQLALALNQQYAQLMQAQQNLAMINRELEKRQNAKGK